MKRRGPHSHHRNEYLQHPLSKKDPLRQEQRFFYICFDPCLSNRVFVLALSLLLRFPLRLYSQRMTQVPNTHRLKSFAFYLTPTDYSCNSLSLRNNDQKTLHSPSPNWTRVTRAHLIPSHCIYEGHLIPHDLGGLCFLRNHPPTICQNSLDWDLIDTMPSYHI